MSVAEAALQYFKDPDTEILGRGYGILKIGQGVQVLVTKALKDFAVDETIQIDEIAYHSGVQIDCAADRHFDVVVVPVTVRIVALAIGLAIPVIGHALAVEAVRGRE